MRMLFLVCAVVLLVHPAVVSCHSNMTLKNLLYDLAQQCNASITRRFFVEDVTNLTHGKCEDKFFCKVQDILTTPKHFCARNTSEKLAGTLEMYNKKRNVNCTEALEGVTKSSDEILVSILMRDLMRCIRQRNFKGI